MLIKLCHQLSFAVVAVLFALSNKSIASEVFYRQLVHQYKTNSNIPSIIQNGLINREELDKLLYNAYLRTPQFFKTLLERFADPENRRRIPLGINIDATYIDIQGSDDIELQKHMFYSPRSGHTTKLLNMTDLSAKIIGVLPVASSQSPSSGDGLLISKHIELQDSSDSGKYVRSILRGNDRYFVVLVTDAGFVVNVPNAPVQARGPTLAEVCLQEGAVLLHTSSSHEKFHLEMTPQGTILKVPWTSGMDTLDENVVKFVRLFRKMQEQIHAALKGMFKILDMRHLWNTVLLPLTLRQLRRLNLPEEMFRDLPRLAYISVVCCSLLNSVHPGFVPLYMDPADEVRAANSLLQRLFLENPLLYPDIWPIKFTGVQRGSAWVDVSFRDLENDDIIGFPKLNADSINPIALDIVSGPHALQKADSLLTYMNQLLIKDENLTREQAIQRLQNFPSDWRVQFLDLRTPANFQPTEENPRYCPSWWDETQFGQWHDLRLVRCLIPPSYKSATTRSNFHWSVIGFGREPSTRLGLMHPYDTVYFWRCFSCPARNGSMSMDRHLATLLKALSFPSEYKSTAKTVNILNTVAGSRRQGTEILPPVNSANFPHGIQRRTQNSRSNLAGRANPLYDVNMSTSSSAFCNTAQPSPGIFSSQPGMFAFSPQSGSDGQCPQAGTAAPSPQHSSTPPCPQAGSPRPQPSSRPPSSQAGSAAQCPQPASTGSCPPPGSAAPPSPSSAASHSPNSGAPPSPTSAAPHSEPGFSASDLGSAVPQTGTTDPEAHQHGTAPSQTGIGNQQSATSSPHSGTQATPTGRGSGSQGQARTRRSSSSRQSGRSRGSSAGPDALLNRYVTNIDPYGVYAVPDASQSQTDSGVFDVSNLQTCGLVNDGNVCGMISIIMSFHRINLKQHLINPHFCFTAVHTPDYPSLILYKILSAMPSQSAFSIQLLIESWNRSGRQPDIQPGMNDIPSIAEALVTNMQMKQYSTHPVISKFLASFQCTACGTNHVKVKNWEGQIGAAIPILQLPPDNQAANIPNLLASYLDEPIETRCSNQSCRQRIMNARFVTETGCFTIIAVNRFDVNVRGGKKMNKLNLTLDPGLTGHQLLGELVSCVCHRGHVNHGHFVSYHKVGNQWFLADDSRPSQLSENPLQSNNATQTVELLLFVNNV